MQKQDPVMASSKKILSTTQLGISEKWAFFIVISRQKGQDILKSPLVTLKNPGFKEILRKRILKKIIYL